MPWESLAWLVAGQPIQRKLRLEIFLDNTLNANKSNNVPLLSISMELALKLIIQSSRDKGVDFPDPVLP